MKQSLPGIVSIAYLPCSSITPNTMERYLCGLPVSVISNTTPVSLVGDAECELEAEFESGTYIEEVSLDFSTTDKIPESEPLAFMLTDANGASYLIGVREKPYPEVLVDKTIDTDKNIFSVKVTFKTRKALIELAGCSSYDNSIAEVNPESTVSL